jgi:hypothetical protein
VPKFDIHQNNNIVITAPLLSNQEICVYKMLEIGYKRNMTRRE